MSEWHKIECVKRTRQFLHETGFGQIPENNNPWPTNVPAPPQPPKMECQAQQQQHNDSSEFCSPSDQANSEPNPRKSSLDSLMPRQQQLAHPQGHSADEQNRPLSTGMQPNSSDTIRYLAEGEELEEEEGQQLVGIGQSENVAQPIAIPPFNAVPADFVDYGQVVAPANGQWAISWEQQCQAAHWMSIVDWQTFQQQMPFHCQLAVDSFQPSPVGEQPAKVPLAATENVPSQPIAQAHGGKKRQHQKEEQAEMGKNVQAQPLLQPASSSTSQPQNPVGIGHPGIGGMALGGQQMAEYHGTMLAQVKDFAKSPIIDFLCQVLSNAQQFGSICSFIAKREFKIHHPRTFMDLLNVIKGSPQHKDKSYLQISRALKTYEDRRIEGQVMMRKVAAKRNQYKFFPDMP